MKITHALTHFRHLLATMVLVGFTTNALAHAGLESSVPQANSQVKMSPPELVLTFEKPVMVMKLTLANEKSKTVDFNFKPNNDTKTEHRYHLPEFGNGQYTVNWTSMGKDGHNMKGSFTFSVGIEAKPAPAMKMDVNEHDAKDHSSMNMDHSGHAK